MKKAAVLFIVASFVLTGFSAFAEEKAASHPNSPFNILGSWVNKAGKKADGTYVWEFKSEVQKSTLSDDQVKDKRGKVGVSTGGI